uniref:autotransporter-associated beta strand repeat-containing protein n=1 Tax=Comamonas terrigena TaxID=32013 RepID=UPI0009FB5AB9|nr:autotransporter-associated beta strand repeat-containing protein [Comamonas terrigena]
MVKTGLADLTLSGSNSFSGALNILSGSVTTVGAGALGNTPLVNVGAGASLNLGASSSVGSLGGSGAIHLGSGANLSVGTGNLSGVFSGAVAGDAGLIKLGSGSLELAGINVYTGSTQVNGGVLNVSGSLASPVVQVNSGATLTGSGQVAGAVSVADGGHLAVNSGANLGLGSLVLSSNSNLDLGLGSPATGGNRLITVGGNLTLDGKLNVSDIGGFGAGIYRVIDYTGVLIDNGLVIGTLPSGVLPGDLEVQVAISNQVNLLVGGRQRQRAILGRQPADQRQRNPGRHRDLECPEHQLDHRQRHRQP